MRSREWWPRMSNYALEGDGRRLDWLSFAVVRSLFVASGNNSVVECDLAKVEVAGSNPVSRSIHLRALEIQARYGGCPPKRSAKVGT